MRYRLPIISFALLGAIAACNKQGPVANGANAMAAAPQPVRNPVPTPAGGPPANSANSASPAAAGQAATPIPTALQGRWGLTPEDCTGPLAKAKGLLVINSGELRFYESRAVPGADLHTDAVTTAGTFHFTGEGQSWDRFENLQRKGGKLTRTEGNPTASYSYVKC
jgi:hypothetical protein